MPDRLDPVGTPRQISDRLDPVGTPRPKLPSPFGEGLGVRPGRGWGGVNFRVKLYIISKNNSVKSVVCERSFMMTRLMWAAYLSTCVKTGASPSRTVT